MSPDVPLQSIDAVRAHHEPDLQRSKAPSERDLPVAVIGHEAAVGEGIAEVGRGDAECGREIFASADEEAAGVEVGEEPFVHVHIEAVEG